MNRVNPHEVVSLNIDDLDVVDLERRLEMVVAVRADICIINRDCNCSQRVSCGTFCA